MKSKIIYLSIAVVLNITAKSQIGTQTISDEIPESASVTGIYTYDPGFSNSFVFSMTHGLTAFNQKKEIFLIDSKTLVEKKKIEYPKYKDYDNLSDYGINAVVDLKQNLTLFYASKSNKQTAISAVRINETLTVPEKPEFLFTADNTYSIRSYLNDKKDLCVFTHTREYKKLNKKCFYYRVYNNKLDLLKSDSIVNAIEDKDHYYYVKVFDNGFAIIKNNDIRNNGLITSLSITDLKNNKTTNLDLSNGKDNFSVENIKAIGNDKIVILNYFYSKSEDKKVKNGILKITYNLKTGSSEEKIIYDHIPAGKDEEVKEEKKILQSMITETGICYVLLSQTKVGQTMYFPYKYELVCLGSNTNKWKKQLPITIGSTDNIGMLFSNGNLFLTYINYEDEDKKIDVNNYVFGNPVPPQSATTKQMYKSDVTLLKINSTGNIQQQSFPNLFYKSIMKSDKAFIGVVQGVNGSITSKCKFVKLELNDK